MQRLDHVSLNVSDRPRSIAWYRDVLGLEPKNQPTRDDWPVFMGEFGACIALFRPTWSRPGPAARRQPAFVTLRSWSRRPNSTWRKAHLTERGVDFRFEDHGNAHSVYFDDPDGNVIELTTYEL